MVGFEGTVARGWWLTAALTASALCLEERAEQDSSMAGTLLQKMHKIWSQPDLPLPSWVISGKSLGLNGLTYKFSDSCLEDLRSCIKGSVRNLAVDMLKGWLLLDNFLHLKS